VKFDLGDCKTRRRCLGCLFLIDASSLNPYDKPMTISLTPQQEERLQKLLETKQFGSVEEFIDSSLDAVSVDEAYIESEEFANLVRKKLEASQKSISEGRIRKFDREGVDSLTEEIKRRGRERLAREQNS
jgi:Arc/MetJ-type ribon-helix-helix transcriptional regulator